MFDPGVIHLIDGPNIDRPINTLTLTLNFHQPFDDFEIYFEPTTDQTQHTYKIDYAFFVIHYSPSPAYSISLQITPSTHLPLGFLLFTVLLGAFSI